VSDLARATGVAGDTRDNTRGIGHARSNLETLLSATQQVSILPLPARGPVHPVVVMDARETMNVSLGRTSLVVAASDGPDG
jgi:hypothetical protein